MGYSESAIQLQRPDLADLPRVQDRVAFLFLDKVRVEQGRTGLEAWSADPDGRPVRTVVPAAQLAVLCLGPGTSVTGPAMTTLFRAGTTVIFTGADGLIAYASARPLATDGRWAAAQAYLFTTSTARLAAARTLYQARFPSQPLPENVPLASLRGLEGHRVKSTYKLLAAQHGHPAFRRVTVGATDPVNVCLNRATPSGCPRPSASSTKAPQEPSCTTLQTCTRPPSASRPPSRPQRIPSPKTTSGDWSVSACMNSECCNRCSSSPSDS